MRLTLDGDDQLRDHGQDLRLAVLQQVEHSLDRQEAVRVHFLTDTLHENGQVVVVVQLLDLDFP